jgi:two-component system sensor histidine kinase/response regulator
VGSTFWFTIPLPVAIHQPAPFCDLILSGKNVLVVDDNETNRKILHYLLRSWGMIPVGAASGPSALTLLSDVHCHFDAVILDYHMPEMDGLALAQAIRSSGRLSQVSLILLSSLGSVNPSSLTDATRVDAFLTKPVRRTRLFNALHAVLGSSPGQIDPADCGKNQRTKTTAVRKGRILVVEDNVINQRVTRKLVEKLGYDVDVAANGKEALAALDRTSYLLILMDCQMPVMDGFEATKHIREQSRLRTPILALTASAMDEDRERCMEAGMDGYLTKPLQAARLEEALNEWTVTDRR